MRDYAKISPRLWIGRTGKEIRKLGPDAQIVAFYLLTGPHANLLGLYHLHVLYIVADTGLSPENVTAAIANLSTTEFCQYDHDAEMVWVCEMARYQCVDAGLDRINPADNRDDEF